MSAHIFGGHNAFVRAGRLDALRNRRATHGWFGAHPEILAVSISRPLYLSNRTQSGIALMSQSGQEQT
jgi:hypothetical protein